MSTIKRVPLPSTTRLLTRNPVERVPQELLDKVFLLTVQEEVRITEKMRLEPRPHRYPWTLSKVCVRWRNICLANPRLWSYFDFAWHICPGSRPQTDARDDSPRSLPLGQMQMQLERCRAPTPIFMHSGDFCQCEDQLSLWRTIFAHSGRWVEAHFGYPNSISWVYPAFMEVMRDNTGFHNLQHITFQTQDCDFEVTPLPFSPELNRSLTNIRSLTLGSLVNPEAPKDFPWHRLTSLSIQCFDGLWTDFLIMLTQCKSLVKFDILIDFEYYGMRIHEIQQEVEKASVVLPHLTSFALTDWGDFAGMNALPFLRLPSLRRLGVNSIHGSDDDWEEPCDYELLMSILNPAPPPITELNIGYTGESTHLVALLEKFPQLVSMTFIGACDKLLEVLCQQPGPTHLCPSLQQLKLGCGSRPWSLTPTLILTAVNSRMKAVTAVARLKSIHIIHDSCTWRNKHYQHKGTLEEFKELENALKDGLKQFTSNGLELRFIPSEEIDYAAFSTFSF